MTYSENQVRLLYIAKALDSNVDTVGDITFKHDGNGNVFFEYKGEGGVVRSDLIPVKNISYISKNSSNNQKVALNNYEITLDSNVNSGNPVAGEDYIVKVSIRQFASLSEESMYNISTGVHATSGMTAKDFYIALAQALDANFKHTGYTTLLKAQAYNSSDSAWDEVSAIDTSDTYTKVRIMEVEQPWTLGTMPQETVNFTVMCEKIIFSADEVNWGVVTAGTPTYLPNSKKIADMEYFYHKEMGDQYGNIGWPNVIPTKYIANGNETYGYHTIDIHYAFTGDGENSYRSAKDVIIAVPAEGYTTYTAINAMIGANTSATNSLRKALSEAGWTGSMA